MDMNLESEAKYFFLTKSLIINTNKKIIYIPVKMKNTSVKEKSKILVKEPIVLIYNLAKWVVHHSETSTLNRNKIMIMRKTISDSNATTFQNRGL